MQDLHKIYYLDRSSDSKRNIPIDTRLWILHVKGVGTAFSQKIGSYESNKWVVQGTHQIVHPVGYSEVPKFTPEVGPEEETPELIDGVRSFLDGGLSITGKD